MEEVLRSQNVAGLRIVFQGGVLNYAYVASQNLSMFKPELILEVVANLERLGGYLHLQRT
jgi:hypothetical protein